MNKQAILNSSFYPILCRMNNAFSLKKRCSKGKVHLSDNALCRKSKFSVVGRDSMIIVGQKCRLKNTVIEVVGKNSSVEFADSVLIYEKCYISIKGDNCHCIIGEKTTIGSASVFLEESNTNVEIGKDCMFGRNVCVQTTDFHSIIDMQTGERVNYAQDVKIGDHVWVGYGVTMAKGSEVADDSVVGEHSLVTKKSHSRMSVWLVFPLRL